MRNRGETLIKMNVYRAHVELFKAPGSSTRTHRFVLLYVFVLTPLTKKALGIILRKSGRKEHANFFVLLL